MAEAITYADLRFVKAPLKKSISSRLGQDPGADDDGELTYENVQVPPVPGGPSSLASSGLGNKAAVKSEQPTASWSAVTSLAVGRTLPCRTACLRYFLLGLLLTCLLLGVAVICLGVRYLQVSQQLQQMNRVLEATNSSLRQQLHLKIRQLGQSAEDLQGSRRELAQSQEALQVEQRAHQAAEGQLQACQTDSEKTKETLQSEEQQRRVLEQKLSNMENRLKPFFTCRSSDTCCPTGWTVYQKSCFYISLTSKTWQESQKHCETLSSKLATLGEIYQQSHSYFTLNWLLPNGGSGNSYWTGLSSNKDGKLTDDTQHSWVYVQSSKCTKLQNTWSWYWTKETEACRSSLPFICEMTAFRFPD
ncbi:B-cell differentiation antigen CD72 [Piliocolobus tephrosceles]|uniref:CD72 molecule n=1 Tax=Piliocolobus tephrosceles TaxID=591936 RepID=A0A8C9HAF4_9PRIM|nr:B-cell differentiation antigen CD72 [Piliocolobus tephrosceles]XP_023059007.1 B-cell differentiation antigen CD72 [Piliocolobus tephrosceles]XP_023059008.1 B-cell differentiation antigen CD72 [Piliocolobus tephrosceles]XP_023059009.1 B-cell differentiation antigen CD72 [Piliocolobus tephrosceles]XP_023059010.1 B-cell differentiation antigen CD72 [Piliocolobus tephrosceles]